MRQYALSALDRLDVSNRHEPKLKQVAENDPEDYCRKAASKVILHLITDTENLEVPMNNTVAVNADSNPNSYIQTTLIPGEYIVHQFDVSKNAQNVYRGIPLSLLFAAILSFIIALLFHNQVVILVPFFLVAIIAGPFSIIFGLFSIKSAFASSIYEQTLTNKRLISISTLIGRSSTEVRLAEIESIYINQGVFARAFNYGNIIARGRGIGGTSLILLENPSEAKKMIEIEVEKAKGGAIGG